MRLALSNMISPLFQNWMAQYTNLTVENFTLADSLVLWRKNSPPQNNEAFCEVKKLLKIKRDYLDIDLIFYKNLHVHRLV